MTELLVIGTGLLGGEVARASRDVFDTAVTYNKNPAEIEGCQAYQLDITKDIDLIRQLSPEYIVLTAAMTNVDLCETDREGAWKANSLGPKGIAEAAQEVGAKLIHVSTDFVFDGEQGMYKEEDRVNPINYYGESKLAGERFVQEICPDSVIARTSVLYGWSLVRLNFVTWAAAEMQKGNRINIVNDQYNSPTFSSNLADMILRIRDETGIFHACGSQRISRYDFAVEIAKAFGLDESLINSISSDQLKLKARRPRDSSMDVSKISGFTKPLNAREGLRAMMEGVVE